MTDTGQRLPAQPTPVPIERISAALRAERHRAGISLSELAKRAGIGKSTLSQLETGIGNPSLETLWALAGALEIAVSRLVDPPQPVVRVVRAGEGPKLTAEHAPYQAGLLASLPAHGRHDLYHITAEPGPAHDSDPHMRGAVEHVLLCAGRALVGPIEDAVELHPGDYVSYPADIPHTFKALQKGTSAVLVGEYA
ncbi:helix-turn-helix domain-containing protein [Sciscionella marina]|uniref:helix-turn-helix domain-containing protein n=1 Tax=Sciscionella marina TaxID=508770 RepID=UPI00039A873C|nr:XRE family transcriptional regulator [Sciscionella marina]